MSTLTTQFLAANNTNNFDSNVLDVAGQVSKRTIAAIAKRFCPEEMFLSVSAGIEAGAARPFVYTGLAIQGKISKGQFAKWNAAGLIHRFGSEGVIVLTNVGAAAYLLQLAEGNYCTQDMSDLFTEACERYKAADRAAEDATFDVVVSTPDLPARGDLTERQQAIADKLAEIDADDWDGQVREAADANEVFGAFAADVRKLAKVSITKAGEAVAASGAPKWGRRWSRIERGMTRPTVADIDTFCFIFAVEDGTRDHFLFAAVESGDIAGEEQ